MPINQGMMVTKNKKDWCTPPEVFEKYNKIYNFIYDIACTSDNCLCSSGFYFDKGYNALDENWYELPGHLWLNPPYGRELPKWIEKCHEEWNKGAKIVALIPARTDAAYWHDHIFGRATVAFLKGRIKFVGAPYNAPFPSAIVVWD
jgi:site-specific DNA-methyltransferase (adenine-specific)